MSRYRATVKKVVLYKEDFEASSPEEYAKELAKVGGRMDKPDEVLSSELVSVKAYPGHKIKEKVGDTGKVRETYRTANIG